MSLDEALAAVDRLLANNDAQEAYAALRPVIEYPAPDLASTQDFVAAMRGFAKLAKVFAGDEFAALIVAVAEEPDSPNALYQAAYALYEQHLPAIAATLLDRANRVLPGQPAIVSELCAALEAMLLYPIAALVADTSGLVPADPVTTYLAGFNRLMAGDVAAARQRLAAMQQSSDATLNAMREALAGLVARADALERAGIVLDERALTAWQAVIDGTVLLHESPAGHDAPMHGRYAYVGDSPGLMREGVERLAQVLAAEEIDVERVVAAPDRASLILAAATARVLGVPCVTWAGEAAPRGLVAVWSMEAVGDEAFARALHAHAPGQVLFVHASSWVEPFPYAPDVTTFLHQVVTNPYTGGAMRVVEGRATRAEPDERPIDALVDEIVNAKPEEGSASRIGQVLAVASAVGRVDDAARGGLGRTSGLRLRQRAGSPVPSNRFR